MSNILLFTDTHFGAKNFSKQIWETQINFFKLQVFPYIKKNKITNIICLGDLVHNRNLIDLWLLQEIKQQFFNWFEINKVNLYLLTGNHDCYWKQNTQCNFYKENIKEYKYITYFDEPTTLNIGKYIFGMIPWCEHKIPLLDNCDILCGHFEMKDVPMNTNSQISIEGVEPDIFKKYKLVLSGHYHAKSQKGNIHYIGSPYQLSWGDYSEDKGFTILDDKFNLKFIQNNISPKYLKIFVIEQNDIIEFYNSINGELTQISQENVIELNKHNYIKLITKNIQNQSAIDNVYLQLSSEAVGNTKIEIIDSNEIIESLNFSEIEIELNDNNPTFNIISNYIEIIDFNENIDKKFLIKTFKDLYQEHIDLTI